MATAASCDSVDEVDAAADVAVGVTEVDNLDDLEGLLLRLLEDDDVVLLWGGGDVRALFKPTSSRPCCGRTQPWPDWGRHQGVDARMSPAIQRGDRR
jgi:hypothetical protein